MSLIARDGIVRKQLGQRGHLRRRDARGRKIAARRLEIRCQLVDQEIRHRLRRLAGKPIGRTLKEQRRRRFARQLLGIRALDAVFPLKAVALGIGQLRQLRGAMGHKLLGQVERRQIGVGEQTVVIGRLLGAHHHRALARRLPMARLLVHALAGLEHLGLTADLVGQPIVQTLKRIEVLELGLGAELGGAASAQAHVAVATHRTLLHGAVGDADGDEDAAELLHEQARLLGRAQIGTRDQLDQGCAAAVVVDKALGSRGDAALLAAHMHELGGILLHMDALDADGRRIGTVLVALGQHGAIDLVT